MKAWGRVKAFGLVAFVTGAVLVPLYGDPHQTPVSHTEWARMVLKALEMDSYLPASTRASQVFSILSWKNTLEYSADHYMRADGVEEKMIDGKVALAASAATPGEVAYPIIVVRPGNYELRVRARGEVTLGAAIEHSGDLKTAGSFTAVPNAQGGWVTAGKAHLDPGSYVASVSLPPGTVLQNLEVVPPCLEAIEPPGGWRAAAIATTGDVAVTVLKALDRESDLPAGSAVIEAAGTDFQVVSPGVTNASLSAGASGSTPVAGANGLKVMAFVDVPEAGLYTVSVLGIDGQGQSWLGDGCQKAVLCPPKEPGSGAHWRVLETTEFAPGRHFFSVTLGAGASIMRLRLEKRRDDLQDYIDTLKALGLDLGPAGPITRERAIAAMNFIRERHGILLGAVCGDIITGVDTIIAQGDVTPPGGPGNVVPPGGTPGGNSGNGKPPLGPPAVPPQNSASPVTP